MGFPNAADVCKIIGACREAGVSELKCGPLEVRFSPAESLSPSTASPAKLLMGAAPNNAGEVPEETIRAQQRAETASLEQQELELKEQQVAEMILSNPLEAEELLMAGELELGGERENGDDERGFE